MNQLIFGWIATVISIVYKLPQMYTFYKEKTSKGVSIISFEIQTINRINKVIFFISRGFSEV